MNKYLLLYVGPATRPEDMDETDRDAEMQKWSEWMERVSDNLVTMGEPVYASSLFMDDGTEGEAATVTGYSLMRARDFEHLSELIKDHPFNSEGKGRFGIEAHQLIEMEH